MSGEPEALADRREAWVAAVGARDLDAYAELVTEDVVWLPPGQDAVVGRRAFRDWLRPFFEAYEYEFSVSEVRSRRAGSWAVERGRFSSRMRPAGGGSPMAHGGSYTILWRLDGDGAWRIERYVDDTDLAPARGQSMK